MMTSEAINTETIPQCPSDLLDFLLLDIDDVQSFVECISIVLQDFGERAPKEKLYSTFINRMDSMIDAISSKLKELSTNTQHIYGLM